MRDAEQRGKRDLAPEILDPAPKKKKERPCARDLGSRAKVDASNTLSNIDVVLDLEVERRRRAPLENLEPYAVSCVVSCVAARCLAWVTGVSDYVPASVS